MTTATTRNRESAVALCRQLGGSTPTITSVDDLNVALNALAHLQTLRTAVQVRITSQIAIINAKEQPALNLTVDGETLSLDERIQLIQQAATDAVLTQKDAVFPDEKQTLTLRHGKIAYAKTPPAIQFDDNVTKKSLVAAIVKHLKLKEKLTAYAKRLRISPWLQITPSLDTAAIKAAHKAGSINNADLRKHGLRIETGERVTLTPFTMDGRDTSPDRDKHD